MKIVNIKEKKSSYLLNGPRNFNEIFRNNMTYDNIKSYKIGRLHPLSKKCISGETTEGDQVDFHTLAYFGLIPSYQYLPSAKRLNFVMPYVLFTLEM